MRRGGSCHAWTTRKNVPKPLIYIGKYSRELSCVGKLRFPQGYQHFLLITFGLHATRQAFRRDRSGSSHASKRGRWPGASSACFGFFALAGVGGNAGPFALPPSSAFEPR